MKPRSKILVIAGSDSSGGAGIQADIKTITALGSYAMTAITAVTAQNTLGVNSVYPINPSMKGERILGEKVFGKISEIKDQIDIIDVFRPSDETIEIAKEAVKIRAKVLWLQLDIKSDEARKIVEANNITYIENKCTKIEFEKYCK